jgi:FAD/FMN-containing dehydrogenase/Fe-S oxidoreductase
VIRHGSAAPTSDTLAVHLRRGITGEVYVDRGSQAAYSADASNHRVVPRAVVLPRSTDDVLHVLAVCRELGVPLTARGGGTSIAGSAIGSGVVLDTSRHLDHVLDVDADAHRAIVQPGVVLDDLQRAARPEGLRFGPDPSTHDRCTIGGMIGTNGCGSHSIAWGTTADNVESVTVALASGDVAVLRQGSLPAELSAVRDSALAPIRRELGRFPRQVSGYGLHHLLPERGTDPAKAFVGAEGTLGIVLEAALTLVDDPAHRILVVAGFADLLAAAAAAPHLRAEGVLTIEALGSDLVAAYDGRPGSRRRPPLPEGGAWLLLECAGPSLAESGDRARSVVALARTAGALAVDSVTDTTAQRALWRIRERGAGLATRTVEGAETWPGWEDAAVPAARLAGYLADFYGLLSDHGRTGVVYGHFGEGCVHVRIDHDLRSQRGRAAYREFEQQAAGLVVRHGGVPSGEHGDGRARSELLSRVYSPALLEAFAAYKHIFDPDNLLNPRVLVDPAPLDADLRLAQARPHREGLAFAYRDDAGDLGVAAARCVGVAACRRDSGGGMCPSFRATRDERHSTRGRARLLGEMLDGHLADDGWRSTDVRDALDLCLACKACVSECPVSVDMATYKAEFLYQHYRWWARPRSHLSLGWLPFWLAAARRVPRLTNRALALPSLRRFAGLDPGRSLPALRSPGFAMRRRGSAVVGLRPVLLWVDTFTRTFSPDVVRDAIAVLESAGYDVQLSDAGLCCGLTWVTTGQLGMARWVMRRAVRRLATHPDLPIVTLEPSCGSALRDDLPSLVDAADARRVASRVRTFAQVLADRPLDLRPMRGTVLTQFHCHQRATVGTVADLDILRRMDVEPMNVEEGCCGLAGNFGFEPGHSEVSRKCAEQSFMPVLAEASADAVVLADGFSCRVQIAQMGGRTALHLAQLLRHQLASKE